MNLLAKIRRINDLLQKRIEKHAPFMEMSMLLSELTQSNIYMINSRGQLLGYFVKQQIEHDRMQQWLRKQRIQPLPFYQASAQQDTYSERHNESEVYSELYKNKSAVVVPIIGGRERFGTIIMHRPNQPFCQDDIVLAESASTLLGLKLYHHKAKREEMETFRWNKAKKTIHTLTHSELTAIELVFRELKGKEGLLVTSEIAKKFNISRSILIVALRKLKTAGIIESHSLGVKGTYIKILNEKILDAVKMA